jgi:hypothetical protein
MLYLLIPHKATTADDYRLFTTFALAEQIALSVARAYEQAGEDPDWCCLVGYEGMDELRPSFLFTLLGSVRLRRDKYPIPSS